ncbi:sulfite exporter TauE/SafE family protein [Aeromicrobium sp.]|uniref:sulfite exporter TauE/SafE family protein n=1 Tax=Aeromicrobium sp. TaxID=1871063 RepID=UPI003D6BE1CB
MDPLEQLLVIGAGLGAGVVSASVGVASLISFPVLVAIGLPPVVANASNTVGLIPAGLSGSFGYRRELAEHPAVTRAVLVTSAVGAVAGAMLLLRLPPGVFEALVPWLILFASLLVGFQPLISRWVRSRASHDREADRTRFSRGLTTVATAVGVYGGYFGAGQGVMMVAVLALGLDLELRVVNALKTSAIMAANIVAGVIFVAIADLDWLAIALLGGGALVGGYLGSHVGRALPPTVFRVLVVAAGVTAAVLMLR